MALSTVFHSINFPNNSPVFMALSTVFQSVNSPDNSPLSHSVLLVLFLPYWSFQLCISLWKSFSLEMILCGWLGLKHRLTVHKILQHCRLHVFTQYVGRLTETKHVTVLYDSSHRLSSLLESLSPSNSILPQWAGEPTTNTPHPHPPNRSLSAVLSIEERKKAPAFTSAVWWEQWLCFLRSGDVLVDGTSVFGV